MDTEYDVKTRVTALDELKFGHSGQQCLVVIHAPQQADLGRRFVIEKEVTTIGRGRDNDIVLPSDCVSRRHARLEQREGDVYLVDLASTNGTYINDEPRPVRDRKLQRGDQIKIGDTIFKHLEGSDIELQYHEVIFRMAVTDGLTSLSNRKQLDAFLQEEFTRARRHYRDLAVLMLDIDHFKSVNDTYGHLTGDTVLRGLAMILQKRLRPIDRLGRYGGEEFCAILPETSLANAARIAEELRAIVESHVFVADESKLRVTISVGATALEPNMQPLDLYRIADECLYAAKRAGRNRVCAGAAESLRGVAP
ncbi:MAG TPA: GGDEF domain-containing protein [Steroidobacteraceae bacterium]|nr:GGDEF domain-containing protein [Steroidobacteraceae bacterium]